MTAADRTTASSGDFLVVRNDEDQHSVWWRDRPVPDGWVVVGGPGSRRECLDRIGELWTDLRPASTRCPGPSR